MHTFSWIWFLKVGSDSDNFNRLGVTTLHSTNINHIFIPMIVNKKITIKFKLKHLLSIEYKDPNNLILMIFIFSN